MISTQLILFIKFIAFGAVFGALIGLSNALKLFIKNKIINNILNFFSCITFAFLYIILICKLNFGINRLYLLGASFIGIFIERISLGKLFAKTYLKMYNIMKIIKLKLSKSKIGKIIFK